MAAAVLVAAWGPAVAGVALAVVAGGPWNSDQGFFLVDTANALVYGLVAAVVLSRRLHPVGWLVALTAVGTGIAAVVAQLNVLVAPSPDGPAPAWAILHGTAWVPGTLALMLVVPYLLTDESPPRSARVAIGAGVTAIAATLAVRLADPWPWPASDGSSSPLAVRDETWARLAEPVARWIQLVVVVLGFTAAGRAAWRRHRDPAARGLGWLAIGVALISSTFVPLLFWAEDGPNHVTALFVPFLHLASQAFFPAAILATVLRRRMFGIDLAVSRTLVWGLLTGMLVAGYFGTVALLGLVLPGDGALARVLATAATAAGIQPARGWLQRRVDRLVYGEASVPALSRVGRHLGSAGTPEESLAGMADSIAVSFNLRSVRILEASGPESAGGAATETVPDAVAVPLIVRGEPVGVLLAAPRPGERLDRRTRSALAEVAPLVATTVQLAATTRALRESRGRLAAVRDDERRALRRELHDEIGPSLAGIGLGLAAARNLLPEGAVAADGLLGRLRVEVDARVEEVRVLARGLVPPVLAELGLVPALRELVMRYEADGLTVAVRTEGSGVDGTPPEVCGAVYAIVAEAIRNVSRHAKARACTVELHTFERLLTVSVQDDGLGMAADARRGVGTVSIRERAEGVGGTATWSPGEAGRGTRLELRLPC
ncbi:histidine kinase [Streptomyces bambusae]|uniref:histidine kinase n=1 Tax=Streptomyces bambusae TaxID=1550616 RepID=UPI001CFC9603|nr:histidine kinase [Streptomyces bambusae]MCB5168314.1 histidine kinase [Streptomyces bambusae]